ncbi:ER membrane protein complex subunit 4, putative [Plasmodium malariae]|uniref:ER membrane protein complex subunit 4, putative n=1 Tax=Plasmodium malariae TaxID=5858 RepID=A0A1C3KET5_PLAMA|nr:ER membrane protein complex subunit 4, putative [Plasmodium malariae]
MNRWDFNLRKYNDNNEKLTEPFGYNFEDDVRAAYGNGDSYLKTEKNINCLNKLNKNENNKSNISVYSEKILEKKAWGVCLNAFKGLIMNIFLLYIMNVCSNSGLLPIRSADYFYFLPHQKVKQKVMGNLF